MPLKLGFILAGDTERRVIRALQSDIHALRPDQIEHVDHLLRSWGPPFGLWFNEAVAMVRRAIKRTKRDRP